MIAWAGIKRYEKKLLNNIEIEAKSRWPLDDKAPYMKGPGLKLWVNTGYLNQNQMFGP